MRTLLRIIGVLIALAGIVWFLQGINLLPGSFMTGQTRWAVYGVVAIAVGVGLFILGGRRAVR
jgi:hypothetical protein